MSRTEWERGSLKIPGAAWSALKKTIQTKMSQHRENDYALAVKLYEQLVAAKKGTRGFDFEKAFYSAIDEVLPARMRSRWDSDAEVRKYDFKTVDRYRVKAHILGEKAPYALKKPQKKDYPKFTSSSLHFTEGECSVHFDNETKTVQWDTDENNHAVERARATALAEVFFQALKSIKWTRNTGGTFAGNNEYNKESRENGGGANYVTERFGPLGEPCDFGFLMPKKKRQTASPTKAAKR